MKNKYAHVNTREGLQITNQLVTLPSGFGCQVLVPTRKVGRNTSWAAWHQWRKEPLDSSFQKRQIVPPGPKDSPALACSTPNATWHLLEIVSLLHPNTVNKPLVMVWIPWASSECSCDLEWMQNWLCLFKCGSRKATGNVDANAPKQLPIAGRWRSISILINFLKRLKKKV